MLGKQPPPIGGVTIHTSRLSSWLNNVPHVSVININPNISGFILYAIKTLFSTNASTITHCQTSSVFGIIFVVLSRILLFSKGKIVYSIHSEYWAGRNLGKNTLISRIVTYCIKNTDMIICDNDNIQKQFSEFNSNTKVIIPFLPPIDKLNDTPLNQYLDLPPFDSAAIVFNAYKLAYRKDGSDIYGLDTLLDAFLEITKPAHLILLIPQLETPEKEFINEVISKSKNMTNQQRIHIISKPELDGWQIIAKADIFIRPTITDGDALSLREALHFGTPVIASDCTKRPTGVTLFKTGDSINLAEKINMFLNEKSIDKPFSAPPQQQIINSFLDAYRSLFKQ